MAKKLKQKNRGFALIELMVATFIFSLIMVTALGSLLITIDSAKNARALRTAMDNVNFAMESMTRSIRMGTNYVCADSVLMINNPDQTADCIGGTALAFIPQDPNNTIPDGLRVAYKLTSAKLQRCYGNSSCVDIVAPNVQIETLKFFISGSSPNDQEQASVYILVKGSVMVKGTLNPFAIQTMASQRNF